MTERVKAIAFGRSGPWLVFLAGMLVHYLPYMPRPRGFILGDLTDGYFNLWLLEHASRWLGGGIGWEEFLHTRFFYPENRMVALWSDNLLVPALPYALLRWLGAGPVLAYGAVGCALVASSFWIHYFFLGRLAKLATEGGDAPRHASLLAALGAAAVAFGDSRLRFTIHFQNLLADLVILGAAGLALYLAGGRARHLALALGAWLALCYSAPYHALALGMVGAAFVALASLGLETREIVSRARRHAWLPLAAALTALPMACGYWMIRQPYDGQAALSAAWWQVFTPPHDGPAGRALAWLGLPPPARHIEALAYSGMMLAPVMIWLVADWLAGNGSGTPRRAARATGLLFVAGTAALALAPLAPGSAGWSTALAGMVAAGGALAIRAKGEDCAVAWLLACAALFYITMLGPARPGPTTSSDPSGWGVLAALAPAYDSLRAVGRFGALGLSFALGAVWLHAWRARFAGRPRLLAVLTAAIILGLALDLPRRPLVKSYDFDRLTPDAGELAFFAETPGPLLILPADNLSLIPRWMMFFEQVPGLMVVNGYSGRFSSHVERLHSAPRPTPVSEIAAVIAATGSQSLLIDHNGSSAAERTALAASLGAAVAHEGGHYTVYRLRTPAPGPAKTAF